MPKKIYRCSNSNRTKFIKEVIKFHEHVRKIKVRWIKPGTFLRNCNCSQGDMSLIKKAPYHYNFISLFFKGKRIYILEGRLHAKYYY